MGPPEILFGLGAFALLAGLVYGVILAGRRQPSRAADEATRRNFDKA